MNLLHISDTHSYMNEMKGDFDLIIHSGDFLPNKKISLGEIRNEKEEIKFQEEWIKRKMVDLVIWIKEKPFLFCAGNHDFIDPTPLMRRGGINAIDITNKLYNYNGIKFYGFPYVPYYGYWNNELFNDQMSNELDKVASLCNEGAIDILVTHCPIYGILDYDPKQQKHFGNQALADFFNYKIHKYPKALLTGHVHSANSTFTLNNMFISNAALTQRIIKI